MDSLINLLWLRAVTGVLKIVVVLRKSVCGNWFIPFWSLNKLEVLILINISTVYVL